MDHARSARPQRTQGMLRHFRQALGTAYRARPLGHRRGDTDLGKRIEHDLYYIDNWSVWLDLKIILLTVFKGFVHKNAY